MDNQSKTYKPRVEKIEKVWTPDHKLWVPHNSSEIAFVCPAFGPDTYTEVGKDILSKNLKVPIGDYTASLLHAASCGPEDFMNSSPVKDVKPIIRGTENWVFNRNLWNKDGVYVIQDLKATGISQPLDINELEKMLKDGKEINGIRFSKDKTVRFVPKETYKLGEHTPESFAKDGFIIASCEQKGAEKLAEVSTKFKNNPYIYGIETETPEQRVSVVGGDVGRLEFGGDLGGDGWGLAFGVLNKWRSHFTNFFKK
jgi:hypothetical protein